MPPHGTFILHDAVRPPLPDGDYTLHVSQAMDAPDSSIDPIVRSFRLVGPRYTLPPDQALSVFPPVNAAGAYADRLPQIVLRRRTLPYERRIEVSDPPDTAAPWLALVVLADGEGQLVTNQPLDASLPEPDDKDAPVRDVLRVSERVVQAVFPTVEDLPWLTHAREVDLSDTELALGDDDGWMAVVVANRLPVPGPPDTDGGPLTARRYTAFLVSLEGHEADLPTKEMLDAPVDVFNSLRVYSDAEIASAVQLAQQAQVLPLQTVVNPIAQAPIHAAGADTLHLGAQSASLAGRAEGAVRPAVGADAWSESPVVAASATSVAGNVAGVAQYATGAASVVGMAIDPIWFDPLARIVEFTVLTHWSFTSQPEGDFRWLMQHLDVGMIGTAAAPPPPGSPPDSRPPLDVLDTGHIGLAATSRRGEQATVWYRGPLTPREILRPAATDPAGVLAHASDQLRAVGPDGRENDALAIAFEIGRMLVAAQPGVVAALLDWRRRGYAQARFPALLDAGASALHARLAGVLAEDRAVFSAGVAAGVLAGVGADGAAALGPRRPLVDPVNVGVKGALSDVVARGFGLDASLVASVLGTVEGQTAANAGSLAADVVTPTAPQDFGQLDAKQLVGVRAAVTTTVAGILVDTEGPQ
jgi:hypothetical protein